jgi:hypothetical protein
MRRRDAALVEVDDDRRERLPTEHTFGGRSQDIRLLGHDLDPALRDSPVAVGAERRRGRCCRLPRAAF